MTVRSGDARWVSVFTKGSDAGRRRVGVLCVSSVTNTVRIQSWPA